MSCISCGNYDHPKDGARQGHCQLDGRLTHPGYWCKNHTLEETPRKEHLGLTNTEVRYMQANRSEPTVGRLINLYQMVRASPGDPGARGIFAAMLNEWRRDRPRGVLETQQRSAGNQAGTDESTPNATRPNPGRDPQARR